VSRLAATPEGDVEEYATAAAATAEEYDPEEAV